MPKAEMSRAGMPAQRLLVQVLELIGYVVSVSASRAVWTLILVFVGTLAESVSVAMLIPVMHLMAAKSSGDSARLSTLHYAIMGREWTIPLEWVLIALACTVALSALISRSKMLRMSALMIDTMNRIRAELFDSLSHARWATVSRLRLADLDHLLTGDIDRVQLACAALFFVIQGAVFLAGYIGLSALISFKMTLFASVAGLVMFIAFRTVRRRGALFGDQVTSERKKQYRTIGRFLSSLKVIKSYRAEIAFSTELSGILARMREQTMAYMRMTSTGSLAYQIAAAVIGCLFVYLCVVVFHLESTKILILSLIFMRLAPRFKDLQDHLQTVIINIPAFSAMMETKALCDAGRENSVDLEKSSPLVLRRNMEFRNVSFSYDGHPALIGVTASVKAGVINALVGQSGGGKSTFADLAMGLQAPEVGEIAIDGQPLNNGSRPAWRSCVAYVPQDTFLLHGTVAENLSIGLETLDSDAMWQALKLAHADEIVTALPLGLETLLGDGGTALSGGERQRIALARALAHRPQLLILDEVTSALDEANTDRVIETLRQLRGGTTILLITHNPQVAAIADHVITLKSGHVVQD